MQTGQQQAALGILQLSAFAQIGNGFLRIGGHVFALPIHAPEHAASLGRILLYGALQIVHGTFYIAAAALAGQMHGAHFVQAEIAP